MQKRTIVLIVGRNPFYRMGLAQALRQQDKDALLEVLECGPGEGGSEALTQIANSSPDVVLLEIGYPLLGGLELARSIARDLPGIPVVVLSDTPHDDDDELLEVVKTGAVGYVRSVHCDAVQIIDIVNQAAKGGYPIRDSVSSRPRVARRVLMLFQGIMSLGKPLGELTGFVTPREQKILASIAEGASTREIAAVLGVSEQTVKNSVSALLHKMHARDRAHAVFTAVRLGLIPISRDTNGGRQE